MSDNLAGSRPAPGHMVFVERCLLVAVLGATSADLLIVALNDLAPERPGATFGLVLWWWLALYYVAISGAAGITAWGLGRLARRGWVSAGALGAAGVAWIAAVLAANWRVVALLPSAPSFRLRWLGSLSLALCAAAILSAAILWSARGRRACLVLGALAVAAGLGALAPPRATGRGSLAELGGAARPWGERLLVIGVDGADWDHIGPLMARGELPILSSLRERGAWGSLRSFEPTLSPIIWTSIATGKPQKEHGIDGFAARRLQGAGESLRHVRPVRLVGFEALWSWLVRHGHVYDGPASATQRRVPAFWSIATRYGSPVSLVTWWVTWPAEPVFGYVVSDRVYHFPIEPRRPPRDPDRVTYPESLYREVAPSIMRPEEMTLDQARLFLDASPADLERLKAGRGDLPYFFSMFETTRRLALDVLDRGRKRYGSPTDLLVLFRIVDNTCHTNLKHSELVSEHLEAPEDRLRALGRVVSGSYRVVDQAIGQIVQAFGEGTVVVLSDHGFQVEKVRGRRVYNHTLAPDGMFIGAGAPFRAGRFEGLTVYDVLPLLLYVKGFPVARDLAGRLRPEVLDPGYAASHPVRTIATYGVGGGPEGLARPDPRADGEMLERLRALGYVE